MENETLKSTVRRRPERLFVSLNAREKAAIEAAAANEELNMTEWARGVLLASAKKTVRRGRLPNDPIEQTNKPQDRCLS